MEITQDAKTHRFMAARYLAMAHYTPYFSKGLMALRPVPIEGFRAPAGIRQEIDENGNARAVVDMVPTMATDKYWRVYYDPAWLESKPVEEIAWTLVHELLHLLRLHHKRALAQPGTGPKAQLLKNVCQDFEINDDIRSLAKQRFRIENPLPGAVYPEHIGEKEGELWETYYHKLLDKMGGLPEESEEESGGGLPGDLQGHGVHCGSSATGVRQSYELPPDDSETPGIHEVDQQLIRESVAHDVRKWAQKSRGTLPGWLERWAEEVLTPKGFNPYELLRSAVMSTLASARGRALRSYRYPNWETYTLFRKMLGPHAPVLPGYVSPQPSVGFIIDTSGSVSEKELAMGIGVVNAALQAFPCGSVYVMACDAAAGPLQRVFSVNHIRLQGGGGTSMVAGLLAIQKQRLTPDVVVVLTDGETDYPTPDQVKGIRHLIWGIYHDKSRVPPRTPGRVIELRCA